MSGNGNGMARDGKLSGKWNGKVAGKGMGWALFIGIWLIAGILAIPAGIYCMAARPSDQGSDLIGLLLAIFLGPLYWIYFFAKGGYCRRV